MPVRNFTLGEMSGLAKRYVGADQQAVLALDNGVRLLAFFRSFILLVASQSAPDSPLLRQLDALLAALDVLHDRLVRGLMHIFAGLIELADTPEEAERWQRLRDRALPEGQAAINKSWFEAGELAASVDDRLDDADRQLMAEALPGGRTIGGVIGRLAEAGRTLHEKDPERAIERNAQKRHTQGQLTQARNEFIQAIDAMRTAIKFQKDLSDDLKDRLLSKLDEVEKLADARALRRRAAGQTEVPEEEGSTESTPTPPEA